MSATTKPGSGWEVLFGTLLLTLCWMAFWGVGWLWLTVPFDGVTPLQSMFAAGDAIASLTSEDLDGFFRAFGIPGFFFFGFWMMVLTPSKNEAQANKE